MHLYADYIVPITGWLHHHPYYALIFTFFIAFLESLAVIGTIIPGSLTMTAIGILAGSDVMRLDLTLMFAALGAFVGDSASYMLGAYYRDSLRTLWPFSRYPYILRYGQEFFERHGGKSVLIGRFTGPLRSITPIIAGMMHMSQWQFFSANFISAIGWAILYVIPGYIIGAASHQLSAESAQRLFAFVMGILILVWILSLLIKYLARAVNLWFAGHVNKLWRWTSKNKTAQYFIKKLIHKKDPHPQKVFSLSLICLACLMGTLILCCLVWQSAWLGLINQPVTYFLQTLRTQWLDNLFITATLVFTPLSLISFWVTIALSALIAPDRRFLKYWISLILCISLLTYLCSQYLFTQPPIRLFAQPTPALFPAVYLSIATALSIFLINYLLKRKLSSLISIAVGCLTICLLLNGIATLFLGDNWLSSILAAYTMGASVGLLHWICYCRKSFQLYDLTKPIIATIVVVISTLLYTVYNQYTSAILRHTHKTKQYMVNHDTWWYQYDEPILPIYATNRVGRRIGVFNVQYAGSLDELAQKLETCGWKSQPKSFLYSLIIYAEGRSTTNELPFMEQLYLNRNPALTMTYRTVKDDNLYILRLWQSNYHLMHYRDPIWLGNIILARKKSEHQLEFSQDTKDERSLLFVHILPAVHDYQIARMDIENPQFKGLPYEISSELLIIKN